MSDVGTRAPNPFWNPDTNEWDPDSEPWPSQAHGVPGVNDASYPELEQDQSPGSGDPLITAVGGDNQNQPRTGAGVQVTHHVVHHVTEEVERAGADYATFVQAVNGTAPVNLLPRNDNRREATIVNDAASASAVYIGKNGGAGAGQRFKLAPGASLTYKSRRDVWVACALATDTATVYAWDELNAENTHILEAS